MRWASAEPAPRQLTSPLSGAPRRVMLPALEVAPLAWEMPPEELAIDAFHHAVYAGATSLAYAALDA